MVAEFSGIKKQYPGYNPEQGIAQQGFVFIIPEKVNQPEATGDNHKAATNF
ncbi:MAG TPA: hypothetical protein PKM83_04560 [Ferruginibacter sp.]|nr:hypothetical protein [Ferruginibacter sp.]HNJ95743.1 hypothetical protein [Ferruginibacter sp.]HNO98987.1 hypothetical protein [Ferruginibacter sp.]